MLEGSEHDLHASHVRFFSLRYFFSYTALHAYIAIDEFPFWRGYEKAY